MKPESKLHNELKDANKHVFMERVENALKAGTPDTYFSTGGVGGWLELKISTGKRDKLVMKYTVPQRRFARKHVEKGGLQLMAIRHGGKIMWWIGADCIEPENTEPFHHGVYFPELRKLADYRMGFN